MARPRCAGATCFWTGKPACLFNPEVLDECAAGPHVPLLHKNEGTGDPHWLNPRVLTKEQRQTLGDEGKARVAELEHEGAADGR